MRHHSLIAVCLGALLSSIASVVAGAQQRDDRAGSAASARVPTGWEKSGVPALNFDADEGFGFGAALEFYNYGAGVQPYRFTIQPTLLFTTEGRRDVTAFFDAPALLAWGWRMTAFVGSERQLAQPYYGVGNATPYDAHLESPPNPYYYRYGRARVRAAADFQHRIARSPARLLLGAGVGSTSFDLTPRDTGTTLLASQLGGVTPAADRVNYLRAGLLWDTRDREIGPSSGTWAEVLVQRASKSLGSTEDFTRWTTTLRQYEPISSRLTFAQRFVAQGTEGNPTFDQLSIIQSSFKQQEGLGGSSSIRGVPKDRYIGKALLLSNSELRWRTLDFSMFDRRSFLALSAFADAGRVWTDRLNLSTALDDLHVGYGAGVRLGVGPSFIVSTDIGHSNESMAAVYIGLGWMY